MYTSGCYRHFIVVDFGHSTLFSLQKSSRMFPIFILVSMSVLAVSTVMALLTNSFIIAINLIDKVKSKNLSPSDLIVMILCVSNIFLQLVMLVNDYMSFACSDIYFTSQVYIVCNALLMLPIYCSFWLTVCLSINYYLQIVIATHPLLIRLKLAAPQLVPYLLMASIFISFATGIPATWNFQQDSLNLNMSLSTNDSAENFLPSLNVAFPLPSTLILCSLPLVLVGITLGLIIKSLVAHTHSSDRNAKGELSGHAEGRVRAARTISCLLFLYISFYISEVLLFIQVVTYNTPGFCTCLIIIYSYSPAQSIVLIFGSPKLKQASQNLIQHVRSISKEKPKKPTVLFIKLRRKKTTTVNLPAT